MRPVELAHLGDQSIVIGALSESFPLTVKNPRDGLQARNVSAVERSSTHAIPGWSSVYSYLASI
jgi:hypothetical protein